MVPNCLPAAGERKTYSWKNFVHPTVSYLYKKDKLIIENTHLVKKYKDKGKTPFKHTNYIWEPAEHISSDVCKT